MSNTPVQPLVLTMPKSRLGLMMLASLGFVAASWWMISKGETFGWVGLVFFGLAALLVPIQLLPGANSLTLTHEGFQTISLFRKRFTRWEDVTAFEIGKVNRQPMLFYNYTRPTSELGFGVKVTQDFFGWDAGLGNNYGMPIEEFERLMNAWRFMALAARQG